MNWSNNAVLFTSGEHLINDIVDFLINVILPDENLFFDVLISMRVMQYFHDHMFSTNSPKCEKCWQGVTLIFNFNLYEMYIFLYMHSYECTEYILIPAASLMMQKFIKIIQSTGLLKFIFFFCFIHLSRKCNEYYHWVSGKCDFSCSSNLD